MVFIVGPSGAGKSTLMKLLYREERNTHGQILINNIDVSSLANDKVPYLRRRMGIIFQDFKLLPNKNIFDNIAYGLRGLGVSEFEIQKRVGGALNLVGLLDRADAFPDELSVGDLKSDEVTEFQLSVRDSTSVYFAFDKLSLSNNCL